MEKKTQRKSTDAYHRFVGSKVILIQKGNIKITGNLVKLESGLFSITEAEIVYGFMSPVNANYVVNGTIVVDRTTIQILMFADSTKEVTA